GGCMLVCTEKAIAETDKEIGTTEEGYIDNIQYVGGILRVREAITPPLIKAVKKHIMPDSINIIDAPPGTSCPVIESVQGCNYLVLVTEPTPFGLNDLVLAVNMARELGIPFGIVINRADIGDDRVVKYCNDEHIHIISQIPDSREIAERYSRGEFADFFIQNYPDVLEKILESAGIRTLETWRTQ
ncbi:MAG TPA: (4Fe-4S)-binding protein, partial [Spirochaetota bacterium]|nr:(4Fe-4S)-binding protein [Spirochaetota bacterium]